MQHKKLATEPLTSPHEQAAEGGLVVCVLPAERAVPSTFATLLQDHARQQANAFKQGETRGRKVKPFLLAVSTVPSQRHADSEDEDADERRSAGASSSIQGSWVGIQAPRAENYAEEQEAVDLTPSASAYSSLPSNVTFRTRDTHRLLRHLAHDDLERSWTQVLHKASVELAGLSADALATKADSTTAAAATALREHFVLPPLQGLHRRETVVPAQEVEQLTGLMEGLHDGDKGWAAHYAVLLDGAGFEEAESREAGTLSAATDINATSCGAALGAHSNVITSNSSGGTVARSTVVAGASKFGVMLLISYSLAVLMATGPLSFLRPDALVQQWLPGLVTSLGSASPHLQAQQAGSSAFGVLPPPPPQAGWRDQVITAHVAQPSQAAPPAQGANVIFAFGGKGKELDSPSSSGPAASSQIPARAEHASALAVRSAQREVANVLQQQQKSEKPASGKRRQTESPPSRDQVAEVNKDAKRSKIDVGQRGEIRSTMKHFLLPKLTTSSSIKISLWSPHQAHWVNMSSWLNSSRRSGASTRKSSPSARSLQPHLHENGTLS